MGFGSLSARVSAGAWGAQLSEGRLGSERGAADIRKGAASFGEKGGIGTMGKGANAGRGAGGPTHAEVGATPQSSRNLWRAVIVAWL